MRPRRSAPDRRTPLARRSWLLGSVGLIALALGGYAVVRTVTRETAEPASVRAAVARFRALPPAARTLPPALRERAPAPGVYVYATRGFEVSHVLGTRRHAYPRRTAITVAATPAGCLRTRWDALATRWDASLACPRAAGGLRLASLSEEHRFVGHVDRRTYRCTAASTARAADVRADARWSSRCAIDGTTTEDRTVVLGPRTVPLAGRPVRTLLLRTATRVSGETVGAGTTLSWVLPRSGLAVRRLVRNASTTETIVGPVAYVERYALTLVTPAPRR